MSSCQSDLDDSCYESLLNCSNGLSLYQYSSQLSKPTKKSFNYSEKLSQIQEMLVNLQNSLVEYNQKSQQ